MSLTEISQRLSPPAVYGRDIPVTSSSAAIYDNTLLPYFLMENGGEPRDYRKFLTVNRIGSVFDDMYPGMELIVHPVNSFNEFSRHPEA
jgi:hypothetical protein